MASSVPLTNLDRDTRRAVTELERYVDRQIAAIPTPEPSTTGEVVGVGSGTSTTGIGATDTVLNGLSVTFTAVSGRRYRASLFLPVVSNSTSGSGIFTLVSLNQVSGGNLNYGILIHPNTQGHFFCLEYVSTSTLSGSVTWRAEAQSTGTASVAAGGQLIISDAGAL